MNVFLGKFKETLFSVLPILVLVAILNFFVTPLPNQFFLRFIVGALFIVIGLSVFLFGIDIGIYPLGHHIGNFVSRSNKIWMVVIVGLVIGFFVCIAEPDLQILARQVEGVSGNAISMISILVVVSAGVAIMLAVGLLRIVFNFPLYIMLTILYGIILLISIFVPPEFLAIAFDASGATTGALTVPFILALALGVTGIKRDSKASEKDSFGLVAVTSTGAVFGALLMGLFKKIDGLKGVLDNRSTEATGVLIPFIKGLPAITLEALIALLPVIVIFILFQIFAFKLSRKQFKKLLKGIAYTLIGLALFLTGVNQGFMGVGNIIGYEVAQIDSKAVAVIIGFILGLVTILAEPAVTVLTHQIESVTGGYVRRNVVLLALSIGVGLAVALSIIRIIVPSIQLWHYLLPGFIICAALSFFAPKIFVGIAYDSGGVASGPMTATFILAFSQGVADSVSGADVLKDAFGMIALVAMIPIITLQVLGLIFKYGKHEKGGNIYHV